MNHSIQPAYAELTVACSCGHEFVTRSTIGEEKKKLQIEVCSECHPFYTGNQKIVDTGGRIERFQKKFQKFPHKATQTAE